MSRGLCVEDLVALAVPEQPVLSPDAQSVVYVLRTADQREDRNLRSLWQVAVGGGSPRQLTRGTADSAPAWSPDGSQLAFLREEGGTAQIWLLPADRGEAEQVTTAPMGAGAPVWSPDGTRIGFIGSVDPAATDDEDDGPRRRRAPSPIVAGRLDFRIDGVGRVGGTRGHIHVLDLATRDCRQVTHGDWHVDDFAWSPDSSQLAFTAAMDQDADLTLHSGVYLLNVCASGCGPELVGLGDGAAAALTWTADGAGVLVVGYEGAPVGHAGLLHLTFDEKVSNISAVLDRNVVANGRGYPGALPQLAVDGHTALFCVLNRGCAHLYEVAIAGGLPRLVLGGAGRNVSDLSVMGRHAVVVLETATSFGEIVLVDLSTHAETVLTKHGADLADVDFVVARDREFTISDGTRVHAWLLRAADASGPQPLLLDIHGGPHNAWNGVADEVRLYHQELVARGWSILLINPRGSDGYGEQFYTSVDNRWAEADASDLLEPVSALVSEGIADPARLAVAGYSYGGFMTCWLTSRDTRFAAAVAGGAITDLINTAGTADIARYFSIHEMGAPFWADRARYEALSPLSAVEHVETPTLLLHGLEDLRCPVGQAEQWHTALRERGVTTQLVLYPGGAHMFIKEGPPSHRLDYNQRILDWLEHYAGQA